MSPRFAPALRRSEIAVSDEERFAQAELIETIRATGPIDPELLAAIEATPRVPFVALEDRAHAFRNRSLPLLCGQTIDRPSAFARLCFAAGISAGQRVLEIGTGSGWGTAVVAAVAAKVYTVERWQTLGEQAMERFSQLGCDNVVASVHDGLEGWPRHGPYDRILVDGAVGEAPTALLKQLAPGGFLVAALGPAGEPQMLTRWERADRGFVAEALVPVRMVALIPRRAAVL